MLFALFSFVLSERNEFQMERSAADIFPPITIEPNGTINTWSLFGDAVATEEFIQIVPKIKRSKGAMWTNAVLPKTNWSVAFDMSIVDPDEDFSFGIFYTQTTSADRSFHGGPSRFIGLSILGKFWRHDSTWIYFDLYLLQSDGTLDLRTYPLNKPNQRFKFQDTISFTIELVLHNDQIYVLFDKGDGSEPLVIANDQQIFDYSNFYLGVTAKNTGFASSLVVYQVQFLGTAAQNPSHSVFGFGSEPDGPKPYTTVEDNDYIYRNGVFKELAKEKVVGESVHFNPKTKNMFDSTDVNKVFAVIDETNRAAYEVASYSDIMTNISASMATAVQKLTKRLNKADTLMTSLGGNFAENYKETKAVIDHFNVSLHSAFKELLSTSFNATIELKNELNETLTFDADTSSGTVVHLLYLAGVLEVFVVAFVVFLTNKKKEPSYTKLPF